MKRRQPQQDAIGARRGTSTTTASSPSLIARCCIRALTPAAAVFVLYITVRVLTVVLKNGHPLADKITGALPPAAGASVRGGSVGTGKARLIRKELLNKGPLDLWDALLEGAQKEAVAAEASGRPLVAVEVGVHSPLHCVHAAQVGFQTHCFEPSPKSYKRMVEGKGGVNEQPPDIKARLVPHQEAAGPESGKILPFHSTGGTGDHIGEYDMWRMEKRNVPVEGESALDKKKRGEIIEVPTMRLDDFIQNDVKGGEVHILKVDTQGFEPSIFSGLTDSVRSHSIRYIIFEFWPRGMDLMADTKDMCSGHKILDMLIEAGYELYALGIESHPKAPLYGGADLKREGAKRPLDKGTEAYCRWFFDIERQYPSKEGEEYKFGYWSDFVAVAPGVTLPDKVKKM